ncbi:MAG: chromate transporter [Clostridia bacterium]|nr:chromate transporter [Clostridia bacterium]
MNFIDFFLIFFKIGAFSFGGGYAMIPLFEKEISLHGWFPVGEYEKFIAIAQMLPGPFAIDSAAYIGYIASGLWGAITASVALSLPSFTISIFITKFYVQFKSNNYVKLALNGVRPVILALLASAAYIIGIKPILANSQGYISPTLIKAALAIAIGVLLLKYTKLNTIAFILIFGLLGIVLF